MEPRSLADLKNRTTRYEIVAILPTGTIRVGFTSRVSHMTLLRMAQAHKDAILPHIGENDRTAYTMAGGLRLGDKVTIRKSGRTERDIALATAHS